MEPRDGRKRICLSDMFGSEDFENNGVHQFIVNYCNEKFFTNVLEANTKAEQEEYIREGLEWSSVDYLSINSAVKNNEEVNALTVGETIRKWNV